MFFPIFLRLLFKLVILTFLYVLQNFIFGLDTLLKTWKFSLEGYRCMPPAPVIVFMCSPISGVFRRLCIRVCLMGASVTILTKISWYYVSRSLHITVISLLRASPPPFPHTHTSTPIFFSSSAHTFDITYHPGLLLCSRGRFFDNGRRGEAKHTFVSSIRITILGVALSKMFAIFDTTLSPFRSLRFFVFPLRLWCSLQNYRGIQSPHLCAVYTSGYPCS